jgi:hypothetical protein
MAAERVATVLLLRRLLLRPAAEAAGVAAKLRPGRAVVLLLVLHWRRRGVARRRSPALWRRRGIAGRRLPVPAAVLRRLLRVKLPCRLLVWRVLLRGRASSKAAAAKPWPSAGRHSAPWHPIAART